MFIKQSDYRKIISDRDSFYSECLHLREKVKEVSRENDHLRGEVETLHDTNKLLAESLERLGRPVQIIKDYPTLPTIPTTYDT